MRGCRPGRPDDQSKGLGLFGRESKQLLHTEHAQHKDNTSEGGHPPLLLSHIKYNYIQHVTGEGSAAPPCNSGLLTVMKCATCEQLFKYSALCMHDCISTVIRIIGTWNFGMEQTLEAI